MWPGGAWLRPAKLLETRSSVKKLKRKPCDGAQCRDSTFFRSPVPAPGGDAFFKPTAAAAADAPTVQKQDASPQGSDEEKKDPLPEGLKTAGEQLLKHEPFKKWYEPKLDWLKYTMWEKASPGEKAAMLSFFGVNVGMFGTAFAMNPQLRKSLSDVNIGAPLGLIPYSPIEGFKYKLPEPGKSAIGFSTDFTFNPYLELAQRRYPSFPWTGATLGLESQYDPAGGGFGLTGGKLGLDFFGGGLTAQGSIFTQSTISPYPMILQGPDMTGTLMKEIPGMPDMKTGPGWSVQLNVDVVKLGTAVKKHLDRKK